LGYETTGPGDAALRPLRVLSQGLAGRSRDYGWIRKKSTGAWSISV
jgi:hypothetical protein